MERRRVAITGIGVVSPVGIGTDAFWDGLCSDAPDDGGRRAVPDWDPDPWFDKKEARRTDRFAQFAVAAADMALEDAGAEQHLVADADRSGVLIASGVGGLNTLETEIIKGHEKGLNRVSPFLVPMMMSNAGAASVSMRYGWRGPCETTVTACAAATHAIGNAARLIMWGVCDAVMAGGTESALTPTGIAGFGNMTALSKAGVSKPFDVDRDGFVIAEGAAVLVLEELEAARARGARIYGIVAGSASTADAHHITAPSPDGSGAIRAMEQALDEAGISPGEVRHINAHGTSTPLNDRAEAEAILKVFGRPGPPVTSTTGVTGHALGAAGALEATAVLLSIDRKLIPPTAGLHKQDPEIELDVVVGEPRPWEPGPALSNSFGFGGHNGCVVITPAE
jgi:3-oxoacyl-[acyl-carrier-protein] synthase II